MSQPTRNCPTCNTPLPGVAAFCYVCGTATPPGIHRETGEHVAVGVSGIGPVDLTRKLQRALGPNYELGDRIGAGGFAEVFRARDLRLKRDLAIKVLRPDLGLSPELLQRFRREAETIAALRNAHIVPVFDVGEAEGLSFIIMPLIEGESLRATLDRDGAMPVAEVRRILREACQGLAAAHDAGIIHRDIKPENIMLEGRDKRVLLMDFGIAKAMGAVTGEEGDPSVALTTTGIIIGTPQYMSPEQACGDKTIDARTDQYSLAVVGYRMLSGALPFDGDSTRSVLYQQLVADPLPIIDKVPNLPGGLANAIQRALAKEPNERFPTMREFGEMLDSEATIATRPTAPTRPKPKRRGVLIGTGIAGAVALAAIFMLTRSSGAPETTPPATAAVTGGDSGVVATSQKPDSAVAKPPVADGKPPAPRTAATPGGAAGGKSKSAPPATTAAAAPSLPAPKAGGGPSCTRASAAGDWATAATLCQREADAGNATAQRLLGTATSFRRSRWRSTGRPCRPSTCLCRSTRPPRCPTTPGTQVVYVDRHLQPLLSARSTPRRSSRPVAPPTASIRRPRLRQRCLFSRCRAWLLFRHRALDPGVERAIYISDRPTDNPTVRPATPPPCSRILPLARLHTITNRVHGGAPGGGSSQTCAALARYSRWCRSTRRCRPARRSASSRSRRLPAPDR